MPGCEVGFTPESGICTMMWRFILIAHILLLTSCTQATHVSSTIVTFACFSHEIEAYLALADSFTAMHPDIEIRLREVDDIYAVAGDEPLGLLRKLAETADTFAWLNSVPEEGARLGLLKDLQPYLTEDLSAAVPPALLDAFRWKDGVYALPVGWDLPVIYYNKNLLDAAEVPYPRAGWTWQDFLAVTQRLTFHEGERGVQYGYVNLSEVIPIAFVYQHGGVSSNYDELSGRSAPSLNGPRAAEALQWYTDLALRYHVMPNPAQVSPEEVRALIAQERVALWSDWVAHSTSGVTIPARGVVPLPGDVAETVPIIVKGYAMSGGTRHPDACWLWIDYLSRQTGVEDIGEHWIAARWTEDHIGFQADDTETIEAIRYSLTRVSAVDPMCINLFSALTPIFTQQTTIEDFVTQLESSLRTQYEAMIVTTPGPVVVATPIRSREQEHITFGIQFGPGSPPGETYERLARIFQVGHSDVVVEVEELGWEINGAKAAKSTDVFLSSEGPPIECKTGADGIVRPENCTRLVLDLSPFLRESGLVMDDFPRLTTVRSEGKLWGLPLALDAVAVYYNKAIFDQAGLPYPQAGWTWDDFTTYAVTLAAGSEADRRYGFMGRDPGEILRYYIEAQGITLLDVASDQRFYFTSPEMREAVQWWRTLVMQYNAIPPVTFSDQQTLARQGRLAMWTDFVGNAPSYPESLAIGLVPLPKGKRSVSEIEQYIGYISTGARHSRICWEWLLFLSNHLPINGKAPARQSLLQGTDFRAAVGEDAANAFVAAFNAESNLNALDGNSQFSQGYNLSGYLLDILKSVAAGTEVETALGNVQDKATSEWR